MGTKHQKHVRTSKGLCNINCTYFFPRPIPNSIFMVKEVNTSRLGCIGESMQQRGTANVRESGTAVEEVVASSGLPEAAFVYRRGWIIDRNTHRHRSAGYLPHSLPLRVCPCLVNSLIQNAEHGCFSFVFTSPAVNKHFLRVRVRIGLFLLCDYVILGLATFTNVLTPFCLSTIQLDFSVMNHHNGTLSHDAFTLCVS